MGHVEIQRGQTALSFVLVRVRPIKIITISIEIPPHIYFQLPPKIPAEASTNPQSVMAIIGIETTRYLENGILSKPSP
jgi:hypothetical protein